MNQPVIDSLFPLMTPPPLMTKLSVKVIVISWLAVTVPVNSMTPPPSTSMDARCISLCCSVLIRASGLKESVESFPISRLSTPSTLPARRVKSTPWNTDSCGRLIVPLWWKRKRLNWMKEKWLRKFGYKSIQLQISLWHYFVTSWIGRKGLSQFLSNQPLSLHLWGGSNQPLQKLTPEES